MKIAIIRKRYSFHGGAEGFSNSLIQGLAERGHEIHIFAISWNAGGSHPNIYFHKVPAITSISFLRDLTFALSSRSILKKERNNFDIIQTHDKTLLQDVYRAGDGCHIEWLHQRRKRAGMFGRLSMAVNPYHWLILSLERSIFKGRRYKKIIAISAMVKRNIIENYNVADSDIEVIYNGVDAEKFHPGNRDKYMDEIRGRHGIDGDEFVILFVGSGFERKGLKFLLKAAESIQEPVTLMIVGKGKHPPQSPLSKGGSKESYPHKQKIIFCGPQQEINKYYAAADIFVFPTMYEPFGNVHLEALASGLPVITTRLSGASEIIEDGRQGFVLDKPEDTEIMAEKIRLLMDEAARKVMASEARMLAEGFTQEENTAKTIKLYEEILKKA